MPFVEPIEDEEFAAPDRELLGYTPNYNRLFARRPAAYAAWKQLNGSIKETMDLRRYELATVAAAGELRSSYCSLAHGKVLFERFGFTPGDAVSDEERAVQGLARKIAADATSVTDEDIDRLRGFGLTEDEIFDVVLAAAARCFFSKTLDALGVAPDAAYRELPPEVREPLTVGRPIEN
ncbi:MAG: carboxymuconolactone decarboxylase family protein [Gaiellaceae bacterium]